MNKFSPSRAAAAWLLVRAATVLAFSLGLATPGTAQFENRFNLYVGLGLTPFQPDRTIQTESVFAGYRTTPVLHGYLGYSLNRKLAMGGALRQMVTSKDNYLLTNTCLGYGVKYNFIPFDKPVSPFLYGELGINYTYLSQSQNTQLVTFGPPADPTEIRLNDATLQEPEIQINIFPTVSAMLAGGAEFTFKRVRKKNMGAFVIAGYLISTTADHRNVVTYFPRNESQLNYFFLCTGFRFSFLQRKTLY